jgi:anti-sigma B factor antagonist
MLNIQNEKTDAELLIALEGRLDTTTAPQLEEKLNELLPGVTSLTFDLTKLEYVSSAGLRVFLYAQKKMNKQGSMVVKNISSEVMGIFDVTGFSEMLTIQ